MGPPQGPAQVPWRGRQVSISVVIVAAAAIVAVSLIVWSVSFERPAMLAFLTSMVLGLVILAAVGLAGLLPYRAGLSALGLTRTEIFSPRILLLICGVLLTSLGATALYSVIVTSIGIDILMPPDIPQGIVFPGSGAVLTFIALALWTPITEEIFFRGFIFAGLTPRLGVTRAMIASALIFSVFHLAPGVMIPIFITGLLLAWLYRQTGSVWPSIAAHAGQNSVALLVTIAGF
ncbi:MAG: CPBP family intramembrane metalloprotease [Chloroflexi bacterium]|nr:CPBP family intramembrane metalloprotease [Chloroflexota bacterium]